MWWRRKTEPREQSARLAEASEQAEASLARARADHAREKEEHPEAVSLAESLRRIREQNHLAEITAAAFSRKPRRGEGQ